MESNGNSKAGAEQRRLRGGVEYRRLGHITSSQRSDEVQQPSTVQQEERHNDVVELHISHRLQFTLNQYTCVHNARTVLVLESKTLTI